MYLLTPHILNMFKLHGLTQLTRMTYAMFLNDVKLTYFNLLSLIKGTEKLNTMLSNHIYIHVEFYEFDHYLKYFLRTNLKSLKNNPKFLNIKQLN